VLWAAPSPTAEAAERIVYRVRQIDDVVAVRSLLRLPEEVAAEATPA
jgi:hypothetical protein